MDTAPSPPGGCCELSPDAVLSLVAVVVADGFEFDAEGVEPEGGVVVAAGYWGKC